MRKGEIEKRFSFVVVEETHASRRLSTPRSKPRRCWLLSLGNYKNIPATVSYPSEFLWTRTRPAKFLQFTLQLC